jgi:hypothetical protein
MQETQAFLNFLKMIAGTDVVVWVLLVRNGTWRAEMMGVFPPFF